MKEKIKGNNYFYLGLTIFCAVGAAIILYFVCLRIDILVNTLMKLYVTLKPVLIGIIISYLLNPLVLFLENNWVNILTRRIFKDKEEHKKFKRVTSISIIYFFVLLLVFLFMNFIIPNLLSSLQLILANLQVYIDNIYTYLKNILRDNALLSSQIDSLNTNITEYVTNTMMPSMDTLMTNVTTGITGFIKGIINIIIGLIISIYLIYDKENFLRGTKKVLRVCLPDKAYDTAMTTLIYTEKMFGGFLMAKIIDSLIIGVITFFILLIFKIPYALVISIIVGVTNIIPYFGPFIGAIPSGILLLLIDPKKCVTFVILILIIQQFDGNIIGPKIIGNKIGIKSFWVLFSILLFGGLFGFVGMLFGVPAFAVIYSVISSLIDKKLDKRLVK